MKILPIEKIREADAYTIKHEPIADIDLMERAATELVEWIVANSKPDRKFNIFCGMGNNAGDGFALGRMLAKAGIEVSINTFWFADKMSPSCQINYERAKKIPRLKMLDIKEGDVFPGIKEQEVVVDALFGSGLTRSVKGFLEKVVTHINNSKAIVISIDAPSGFFCDESNATNDGAIVKADYTLTFQFPKLGFLFPENDQYIGHWEILNIGLHSDFVNAVDVKNYFVLGEDVRPVVKKRGKFSHKGTFGHGLLIAGSYGKMGAAVLASKAGLRAGAGLITAHVPVLGNTILQTAAPEVMVSIDNDEKVFSKHPNLSNYNAVAIGPGIGTDKKTETALKLLIQNCTIPIIFDADAINILANNKTWISFIQKGSIFTPHPKEFERLIGVSKNNFDRNKKQREFSIKYGMYVILKGAHTAITCPDGSCYFNSTGNPGMATGGSGDSLTGILLGLGAQGYTPKETCILGVYLHGLAADLAAEKWGYEALTAGNITHNLGKAYKKLTSHI